MPVCYPTRVNEEPRITAEHVKQAEQAVKRAYAEPYVARAQARMRGLFMAGCMWMLFVGWVFGSYLGHTFPFGVLGIAIIYTVLAIRNWRRNRD